MNASALKVHLQDLMLKREEIEGDISLRSQRLTAAGVGLKGSLVDGDVRPFPCRWGITAISLRIAYLTRSPLCRRDSLETT